MAGDTSITDADLEMIELAELANETDAETCRACGEVGLFITLFRGLRDGRHVEEYECSCGHYSVWINHRRQS